jgi:hypothetical protein
MKAIASAVEEARKELQYVTSEITALTAKRKQLDSFIATGRLLAKTLQPEKQVAEIPKPRTHVQQQPSPWPTSPRREMWQNAVDALKKLGHPATVGEVVEMMGRQGTPVGGSFQRASLRSMFARRKDVFEKVAMGFWALREWSVDMKQLKQVRAQ